MQLLESPASDPAWNLAAEEYLLKQTDLSVCFIYRNSPAVVVGRNQHLGSEVNLPYLQAHSIGLYRRLSGGGAVYHDEGNLNVAFIENGHSVRFDLHRERICQALQQMGIPAEPGPRSDITLQGRKISGNAAAVSRNRVLHHGTLLFAANLDHLQQVLIPHTSHINSPSSHHQINSSSNSQISTLTPPSPQPHKGVRSIPSQVVNIRELYPRFESIESFQQLFVRALQKQFDEWISLNLSDGQLEEIGRLRISRYRLPEWILGSGTAYQTEYRLTLSPWKP